MMCLSLNLDELQHNLTFIIRKQFTYSHITMSQDYTGGFPGQRGNFNNQAMPMNQMGMNNQVYLLSYGHLPGALINPVSILPGPDDELSAATTDDGDESDGPRSRAGPGNDG